MSHGSLRNLSFDMFYTVNARRPFSLRLADFPHPITAFAEPDPAHHE
jgi:hypothetical protein